jgi:hypothetical protein
MKKRMLKPENRMTCKEFHRNELAHSNEYHPIKGIEGDKYHSKETLIRR